MYDDTAPMEDAAIISGDDADVRDDAYWLARAREGYRQSSDYYDTHYRSQQERNIANFRSKHPPGSKYLSGAYKSRSRLFRPKTRAGVRNSEASFADAMFATREVVVVEADDANDAGAAQVAGVRQQQLNYHLQHTIPWFVTSVGALQEAKVNGAVVSRQYWQAGAPMIDLVPFENIRFDPGADWRDPVNSSPYFIELMPMYVDDVVGMQVSAGWREYSRGDIVKWGQESTQGGETARMAREGGQGDPKDKDEDRYFQIVWVHRNFIRAEGQDWEFYTLATNRMLTDPVPVTPETHPLGRNYHVGITSLEVHRPVPSSDVQLGESIQAEINDVANQRIDNVRLALNKGYFVWREGGVDTGALRRSFPGRIAFYDKPNSIQAEVVPDVTQSSYAEQDRLNSDFDEISGSFSGSSVATNRRLGETVGGMEMFSQTGNKIQGYSIRLFVETWVEPVLNDLLVLCSRYDDPQRVTRFAGAMPMAMDSAVSVFVSVGLGPLDPRQKVKALVESLAVLAKMGPEKMARINVDAISAEVFGVIGFRDGKRFFHDKAPEAPPNPEMQIKAAEMDLRRQELDLKAQEMALRAQFQQADLALKRELGYAKMAMDEGLTLKKLYATLDLDMDKHNLNILKEMGNQEKIKRDREEMILKQNMGEGI